MTASVQHDDQVPGALSSKLHVNKLEDFLLHGGYGQLTSDSEHNISFNVFLNFPSLQIPNRRFIPIRDIKRGSFPYNLYKWVSGLRNQHRSQFFEIIRPSLKNAKSLN